MPVGLLGTAHPIGQAFEVALVSAAKWAAFVQACENEHAGGRHRMEVVMEWLDDYGEQVAAQTATRRPSLPSSTGPVETVLRDVSVRIGNHVGSFTNLARMRNLLMLMAVNLRTKSNGRVWAELIRKRIYLAGGRAQHQRPHDDPKGAVSLFA